ncbi:hypothetical protein AB0F17_64955 [Nonomuraea sp. NPDC026600]|uniref:hypothetical protein n=1 Tax=Nonomuraea sp. NPDC026600 TaxID=3155363 RepID=UPI0033D3B2FF
MARYAHERYDIPDDTHVPADAGREESPAVTFPFDNAAEYAAARSLAAARQQIAHEATHLDTWEELTDKDQEMAAVDALHYLRAGRRIGIFVERRSIDEYVGAYARQITDALDAEDIVADQHEWLSSEADDGPGMYWMFDPQTPPVDDSWTEGVTIVWDWRQGWIDNTGAPLPLTSLAAVVDVVAAIKAHIAARPKVTSTDGPQWHNAAPLEGLLAELAKEIDAS